MAAREIVAVYYIDGSDTGYDNRIKLSLTSDRTIQADLSGVTRWVMYIGAVTVDSDVDTGAFAIEEDSEGRDQLVIDLEGKLTEPVSAYASLIGFDAVNTDGIVWISQNSLTEAGKTRLKIVCVREAVTA